MTEPKEWYRDQFLNPPKFTNFNAEDYKDPRKPKWVSIGFDFRFWAIIPAFNLNFHDGFTFEFEFLCVGVYISKP